MDELIKEVAKKLKTELGIDEEVVRIVTASYFRSFKAVLSKTTYREKNSLKDIKTNIVIPGFGRLLVSWKKKNKVNN